MNKIAIYPGTFDPFTNGHLDIVARVRDLFDHVVVAVTNNPSKTPLFTTEERVALIREAVSGFPSVEVDTFDGLRWEDDLIVRAFDTDGNEVPVSLTSSGTATVSGQTTNGESETDFDEAEGSVLSAAKVRFHRTRHDRSVEARVRVKKKEGER